MINYRNLWDRLGIVLSTLCLVHCTVLPLLIASGSILALSAGADEGFHQWMVWAIVPVALFAVLPGWRRHRRHDVPAGMLAGLALIGGAAWAGEEAISRQTEALLTVCGGSLLVASHWFNLRLCKSCPACSAERGDER